MSTPPTYHTATLLLSGKVLVTGGYTGTNFLSSTETYDPNMGNSSWKAAGALAAARIGHAATLMEDGRVLITGGHTTNSLTSAEVFNPYVSFSNVPQPQVTSATSLLDLGS